MANPLTDDLGSTFFSGGKNPKPKKAKEVREVQVHYTELDAAHWRIQKIYGSQEKGTDG